MDEPPVPHDPQQVARDFLKFMDVIEHDLVHGTYEARRQIERQIVELALPPVDLREIPREQWDHYIHRDVVLPPSVPSVSSVPFTRAKVHAIEDEVERYHGITPPYYIHMSLALQQNGRPWFFIAEAGKFLTGLTLGKE